MKAEGFIEVDELIGFDPYMRLGVKVLQKLYRKDEQEQSLTQDFLMDFSSYYRDKAKEFESILLNEDVQIRYYWPLVFCP